MPEPCQPWQWLLLPFWVYLTLFRAIPPLGAVLADFNSVNVFRRPYREFPSALLAILQTWTNTGGDEPNWGLYLQYYQTPQCNDGLGNLQDLLLLLCRFVLPNHLIVNRHRVYHVYLDCPHLQTLADFHLRYDTWVFSTHGRLPLSRDAVAIAPNSNEHGRLPLRRDVVAIAPNNNKHGRLPLPRDAVAIAANTNKHRRNLPLDHFHKISNRSIFRSMQTPDGNLFLQWLRGPTPDSNQLGHQASEIDHYLVLSEDAIREMNLGTVTWNIIRVLQMVWWVMGLNWQLYEAGYTWNRPDHDKPPGNDC